VIRLRHLWWSYSKPLWLRVAVRMWNEFHHLECGPRFLSYHWRTLTNDQRAFLASNGYAL
jgi:hypothetical protein